MTRLSRHQLLVAVSLCFNVDAALRGGVAGFLEDVFDQNMKVKTSPALDEMRNQTLDIVPDLVSDMVEKKNKTEDSISRGEAAEFIGGVFDPKEDVKGATEADVDPEGRSDALYSNTTTSEDVETSGGVASSRSDTNNTKCPKGVGDDSFFAFDTGRTKGGKKGSKAGDHDDVEAGGDTDDLASDVATSEDSEFSGDMVSNSSETNITKCPKGVRGDGGVKGKKGGKKGGKIDVDREEDDVALYVKGKGESGGEGSYVVGCTGEGCGESIGSGDWYGYGGEGMNYGKGTELGKGKEKGELDYGKGKGSIVDDDDAYFYGKGKGRGKKGKECGVKT